MNSTKGDQIDAEMSEKYDITRDDYNSKGNVLGLHFIDVNMQTFFSRLLWQLFYLNAHV